MTQREEQLRALIAAQALEWFAAHRSGGLSETQSEAFIDWLRASPAHAQEYLRVNGMIGELSRAAKRIATPTETLVALARAEMQADTVRPLFEGEQEPQRRETAATARARHRPRTWAAFGGLGVAMAMIVVAGAWWLHDRTVYSTAHAEQHSWRMPDGSSVHLNSASEIRVRFDAERREVQLVRGQALFQVAADPQRPFWVHTGEAAVKAVGTEFDVYRRGQGTLVSVVEGSVAVWRLSDDSTSRRMSGVLQIGATADYPVPLAQLDAGQQAQISRAAAIVSKRADDVRKTVAWLQRQVAFDHDPLGAAVEELNRYNELRIRVDDPALQAAEVSGIFSAYDVESFIRFLERQPEMRVERVGQDVIVTSAPPLQ